MKYNAGKLQKIIYEEDPFKGEIKKYAGKGWRRGHPHQHSYRLDVGGNFSTARSDKEHAIAYQELIENMGMIASCVFNKLDLDIPKEALHLYLGTIIDNFRELQEEQYLAALEYPYEKILQPDIKKVDKIIGEVIKKKGKKIEKGIKIAVDCLLNESEIDFKNEKHPYDSAKGWLCLQEVLLRAYPLFHPSGEEIPDFKSPLDSL